MTVGTAFSGWLFENAVRVACCGACGVAFSPPVGDSALSTDKRLIFWGFPSSSRMKSFASRPVTGFPCLSFATTSTCTRRTLLLIVTVGESLGAWARIDATRNSGPSHARARREKRRSREENGTQTLRCREESPPDEPRRSIICEPIARGQGTETQSGAVSLSPGVVSRTRTHAQECRPLLRQE
jgi:hypothetical protein